MEAREHPRPINTLLGNRKALSQFLGADVLYTPPSSCDHYVHLYPHDSNYAAMVYADHDYPEFAVTEIFSVLSGQDSRGFSPNQHFAKNGRVHDLERKFFMDPSKNSNYSHPPRTALASWKTYEAFQRKSGQAEATLFLETAYPYLKRGFDYYHLHRQHSSEIPLIFNTHPHETGADSEPITDFARFRIPRNGPDTPSWINWVNRRTDYLSTALVLNGMMRVCNWEEQKTRRLFEFYSPMFNSMLVEDELIMAQIAEELGREEHAEEFNNRAVELERAILEHMYDEGGANGIGLFYGLKGRSLDKIDKVSISNLYPILLPDLSDQHLESLLDLYEYFDTDEVNFPVPTVPPIDPFTQRPNPNYDPEHAEVDRLDRGSTWLHHNFNLSRGNKKHSEKTEIRHSQDLINKCAKVAARIVLQSKELIREGYYEFSNPRTGEPQRTHKVWDFAWSTLGDIM